MLKILKRVYDSKFFTFAFLFSVIGLWLSSFLRADDIFGILKRGKLTISGIILFIFITIMAIWGLYSLISCTVKIAIQIKYRDKPFKFILVYSRGIDNWDKILTSEIKSLLPGSCLVIYPGSDVYPDKWIPYVYGINSPGLLILKTQKKFNLWKSVRKAAYGYPTKLNNLKLKIKDEITRSQGNQ